MGSPAIHFDLFFDVLGVALAGRRLEPSHGPTPRHIVFSITDETASVDESGPVIGGMNPPAGAIASLNASGPVIGGMNPPAGAIAALNALTITMTTKEVRLERGRTAPADAEVALVRGSLAAMTAYLLVGDGRALSSLSLYGRVESLVELGEVLRSQKSMLSLRAEEAPPSKRRRRGAR